MHYLIILFTILLISCADKQSHSHEYLVVGTYTQKEGHVDGKAEGLYILRFDPHTGHLEYTDTLRGCINPSYLAISDDGKNIYAVNETNLPEYRNGGFVSRFIEDEDAQWILDQNMVSNGPYPCHISINAASDKLYVSNYLKTVSVINLDPDGKMRDVEEIIRIIPTDSINPRQDAPHPHMTIDGRNDDEIFISDLGRNQIHIYHNVEAEYIKIDSIPVNDKAGPRHLLYHRDMDLIYILNELNHTIEVFGYNEKDSVYLNIQTLALMDQIPSEGFINSAALHFSPDKKFIYASNRGLGGNPDNTISVCAVNPDNGSLTLVQTKPVEGLVPRDFALSPNGKHLLVGFQDSDEIIIYERDMRSGMIKDQVFKIAVPTPVCLKFFKNFT